MSKLGFHSRWINLIMNCVSSVSYSIFINGTPQNWIKPTRGIRQGDPLSPCLFIICAEALTCLLLKAEQSGALSSVPIGRGQVRISHLFFADNNLLFCKANSLEWCNLIHLLRLYEQSSGQILNREKNSIYFSSNTPKDSQRNITHIAGIKATGSFEKYLGLPAFWERTRPNHFKVYLIVLGIVYLIGKQNFCRWLVERYSLKLFFKLLLPTQ